MLALLVAVTHSILPGVIFHVALNISGSVSAVTLAAEPWVVAATLVVSAAYAAYLVIVVRQTNNVVVRPVTTDAIAPPPETRLAR